jgi:hypothetical protein
LGRKSGSTSPRHIDLTIGGASQRVGEAGHPQPTGQVETNPLVVFYQWKINENKHHQQKMFFLVTY